MEADFITCESIEEQATEVEDNLDADALNGERCGICMDIIIDRGVLDCCQHMFCFGCIDDWATITNLCPLCQNVFQLITCVPVYGTFGSNVDDDDEEEEEEELCSGGDDWYIERDSNTLSFPSYYIDENAVTCLEGSDCKIRSGSAMVADDCDLDTSIACDSCDAWYHASCVGFDPQAVNDDSWQCPRCCKSTPTMPMEKPPPFLGVDASAYSCLDEGTSGGKVVVSVTDVGETAIVVSMIAADEITKNADENFGVHKSELDALKATSDLWPRDETSVSQLPLEIEALVGDQWSCDKGSPTFLNDATDQPSASTCREQVIERLLESDNQFESKVCGHLSLDETKLSKVNQSAFDSCGSKRKRLNSSDSSPKNWDTMVKNSEGEVEASMVKVRGLDGHLSEVSRDQKSIDDDYRVRCPALLAATDDVISKDDEATSYDVMSIVRGTGLGARGRHANQITDTSVKDSQNKTSLRVRKIMRRSSVDTESSVAVQKLREEIRDAVRNRFSTGAEEPVFDPKLLTAFRAAIGGSSPNCIEKVPSQAIKFKKSLLQKGKVRENLTKKIYGNSNGRRRRAWDRDCEVEFWKHRCVRPTKPEKLATLTSVLSLLKNHSEHSEKSSDCQENNSLLTRLYLADTSVFPRKDNVVPLSAFCTQSSSAQNGASSSFIGKLNNSSIQKDTKLREATARGSVFASNKDHKDKETKNIDMSKKSHANVDGRGVQSSTSGGSKFNSCQGAVARTDVKKMDKRKWALEILARKVAVGEKADKEKLEDDSLLKGNFPLLIKLPRDMRPKLLPGRCNKIPVLVRQKQLYRLTEHFLKSLNLPEIRRMAETELAVADAINIEREAAERSNSKIGYLNLCSHEILHRSEANNSVTTKACTFEPQSTVASSSENFEELPPDPDVVDALKYAGLISNSPSRSPQVSCSELTSDSKREGEESSNILETGSTIDADIYGDFEYDLEGVDYTGTAVKVSRSSAENESKMKVILSTVSCDAIATAEPVEKPDVRTITTSKTSVDSSVASVQTFSCAVDDNLSLVECDVLYGSEKDSLVKDASCVHANTEVPSVTKDNASSTLRVLCIGESTSEHVTTSEQVAGNGKSCRDSCKNSNVDLISRKVEAYIKEHVRPLCKSGVISTEQYRWAVSKTTEKVMRYHANSKNANFLIKEGEKVKKLAEKYVEAAQLKEEK